MIAFMEHVSGVEVTRRLTGDGEDRGNERLGMSFDRVMWVIGEVCRRSDVRDQTGAELERESARPPDLEMTGAAFRCLLHSQLSVIFAQTDRPHLLRRLCVSPPVADPEVWNGSEGGRVGVWSGERSVAPIFYLFYDASGQ